MLHATAVLLETFIVAPILASPVQKVKSLEDVVCQRMAALRFTKRLTWPALPCMKARVQFSETSDKLCLLLLKHLDISFGVDFVLRFLSLTEDADSIISFTPATGACTVTL